MRLILYTAAWLILFGSAFGYLVGRAADYEARTQEIESRIVQLQVHDCAWTQYEDYSVSVQADDRARSLCARYAKGEITCDRIVRDGHEYTS